MPASQQSPDPTVGLAETASHGVDLSARSKKPSPKPPLDLDEWDLEPALRPMQGMFPTRVANPRHALPSVATPPAPALTMPAPATTQKIAPQRPGSSLVAWVVLALSLVAFVCGGALLILSFGEGREALWNLGMPITVAGQAGLLIGLILQLERIWQGSRYTADQLQSVDEQLNHLRQTTSMLGVTHGSAAQAFYSHMAEGASPNLLLADLKGQLDLLTVRMADRR